MPKLTPREENCWLHGFVVGAFTMMAIVVLVLEILMHS